MDEMNVNLDILVTMIMDGVGGHIDNINFVVADRQGKR